MSVTRRQELRGAVPVLAWFALALVIGVVVTYLRNLVFWVVAYFGLLGAHLDRATDGASVGSALHEAADFTPLDLQLHAVLLVPGFLLLAALAGRLSTARFRWVACSVLGVLTVPAVVVVPGPVSYHVLDVLASVVIGLLLPTRTARGAPPTSA
jgi:hypothetical protein